MGRFDGDEVYGPDGSYLGEIYNDRLIRHEAKAPWRRYSFAPYGQRAAYVKYVDYVGFVMLAGYEDFAALEG